MVSDENDNLLLFDRLPLPAIWVDSRRCRIRRMNVHAEVLLETLKVDHLQTERPSGRGMMPAWLEGELIKFANSAGLEYSFEQEFTSTHPVRCLNVVVKRLSELPGSEAGLLVVLVDITSQKALEKLLHQIQHNLEAEVEERTEELARANESLRNYIHECKRTETALKTLSSAVEQTADHVIITDKNGVIQYVNPAFETLTGFSNHEALGRTPRIVKSRHHPPEFFPHLWQTILAGEVFRADFLNQKKNGELYVEEKTISPIKDDHGRITHFVSVGRGRGGRKHEA